MQASVNAAGGYNLDVALPIGWETMGKADRGELDFAWRASSGSAGKLRVVFEWVGDHKDILVAYRALPFDPAELVSLAEEVGGWRSATVIGSDGDAYADRAHRDTDELVVLQQRDPRLREYELAFLTSLHAMGQVYRARNPFALSRRATPVSLLRYGPGQRFGLHVDQINREDGIVGNRQLSYVAFLAAPTKGGALDFPRQGVKVDPVAGCAVMFPSCFTHPHEALPVEEGTKVSAVTWLTV